MPAEEDNHGRAEGNMVAAASAQASPQQLEGAAAGASAAPVAASAAEPPGLQPDLVTPLQESAGAAQDGPPAAATLKLRSAGHDTASAVAAGSAQPEGAAAAAVAGQPGLQPRPARKQGKAAVPNRAEEFLPALREHLEKTGKQHLLQVTYLPGWRATSRRSWWAPGAAHRMLSYAAVVAHLEQVVAGALGTLSRRYCSLFSLKTLPVVPVPGDARRQ